MTVHLDARPSGIDLMFRPGNSHTLELLFPQSLTGRTFVSTLRTQSLSLTYAVSSLTVELSATQSDDFEIDTPLDWALSESGNDLFIGTWVPSYHENARSSTSVSVSNGVQSVTVQYASNIELVGHVETDLGDGVHGLIEHDWNRDGWSVFESVTVSLGSATTPWTQSVVANRGRLTGLAGTSTQGNLRIAYLRQGTSWVDSEITSIFHAPSFWSTNNAQIGHMHRIQPIANSDYYMAIVVWTSVVFGGDYGFLHAAAARFGGPSPQLVFLGPQSTLGTSHVEYIDRTSQVVGIERFDFLGGKFNRYYTGGGAGGANAPDGTTMSFSGFQDTSFNLTTSSTTIDPQLGVFTIQHPTATTTFAYATSVGLARPVGASQQLRWTPYGISTRLVGGSATSATIHVKRWRMEDGELPWSSHRTIAVTVTTDATVPTVPTEAGYCGLWGAHIYDSTFAEWGDLRFKRVI